MHVKAKNVFKEFDDKVVIENISFEARSGHVLGILGPDDAGKTTVMRLLLNIVQPTEGELTFDDQPVGKGIRDRMGYLPEERGLYDDYSLYRNLLLAARLKNMSAKKAHVETIRLLDRFKMIDIMDTPVVQLSREMREKVFIMTAIIHNPELLILDEPFRGTSEVNQHLIQKMIQRFREEGKTLIIATSEMNMAESLCNDVVLLHKGQTVLQGDVGAIKERFQENLIVVEGQDNLQSLRNIQGVKKFQLQRHTARLFVDKRIPAQKILEVITKLVNVHRLEVKEPNLHDIFQEIVRGKPQGE